MIKIAFSQSSAIHNTSLTIGGSKSETNRALLLQALFPEIAIENASDSDDSGVMRQGLQNQTGVIDVGHAGTAMRFLTAYFASQPGADVVLTGSERMKQRPIGILVDALRQLGASIDYAGADGFPPLKISGRSLVTNRVALPADVSSQYISALLLIAPRLEGGITVTLQGNITSRPYIGMTLSLLEKIGAKTSFNDRTISIGPTKAVEPCVISIESDWSSASYWYSIVALASIGRSVTLTNFYNESLQGDRALVSIYKDLGVETVFDNGTITMTRTAVHASDIDISLENTPDLAQTIAVTCLGLGIGCRLTGLQTLNIKETNRLIALKNELSKLGAKVSITKDSLSFKPCPELNRGVSISTYDDHRMAMAFAPLALKVPIAIEDAGVVSKSYPNFWNDLEAAGFDFQRL